VKILKLIGLAAMTAMASMALGPGSASAYETTLCKSGTQVPYCNSGERYPANTEITATTSNAIIETTWPKRRLVCESTLKAKNTAESGAPLGMTVTEWSFGGCMEEFTEEECGVGTSNLPFTGSIAWTKSWYGDFTVSSGNSPGWHLECTGVDCEYKAGPTSSVGGGGLAALTVSNVELEKYSGLLCPSTTKLTASYDASPKLWVARAEPRPPRATALCKGFEEYCTEANLYPKGTALSGEATNFTLERSGPSFFDKITCGQSTLKTETTALYSEPLTVTPGEFSFSNCYIYPNWGGEAQSCKLTPVSYFSGSIKRSEAALPDGLWKGSGGGVRFECLGFLCTYEINNRTITAEHGTPGAIRLQSTPVEKTQGSSFCASAGTMTGDYKLSSPSGTLYFTDVLR
jgi:hypothetical protein